MTTIPLLDYFAQRRDEMLAAIGTVVEEETPSRDKERLDRFAKRLVARFANAGLEGALVPNSIAGDHVRAQWPVHTSAAAVHGKPALILCHYDTVWPVGSLAKHPFRVEDGRAYGPGIFDMQSSLVLVEFAFRAVRDLAIPLPRPVVVLVTSDEEVGSTESRALIEAEAAQAEYVFVLESPLPGGVLKTARKGVAEFELGIGGRAAHAGVEPEQGISAIHEAAHQILRIQALGDQDAGTTVNVDLIHGGSASNVIPARCSLGIDARAWTQAEAERVEAALRTLQPAIAGATLALSGGWNRPPLERRLAEGLFVRVQALGRELGLELGEGGTGGGSDGNFTAALGIPTLDGLGVPGAGAHADHEHIEVDQIASRAALLTLMLARL